MIAAFERIKMLGGGIAVAGNGSIECEVELPLNGGMSRKAVPELIEDEKKLLRLLQDKGYKFEDPIYSLLFFSSTHLPYIRITQHGMYDVMNKTVLFPTIMR
jgi:adenine deaminase